MSDGAKQGEFFVTVFPFNNYIGGSAYYKYVRDLENKLTNKHEDILTLDGGNFFQGHPLGLLDNGAKISIIFACPITAAT